MGLARPKPKSRKAMNDQQLFAFENDFVATLRCIPMAVRFKLDRCGIKLTLRQWSRLTHSDRTDLLIKNATQLKTLICTVNISSIYFQIVPGRS